MSTAYMRDNEKAYVKMEDGLDIQSEGDVFVKYVLLYLVLI